MCDGIKKKHQPTRAFVFDSPSAEEGGRMPTDGWEAQKATGKACTGTAAATSSTQQRTDDHEQLYAWWWWWCFLVVRAAATALRPVLVRRPVGTHTHPPFAPPSLHSLLAGGEGERIRDLFVCPSRFVPVIGWVVGWVSFTV